MVPPATVDPVIFTLQDCREPTELPPPVSATNKLQELLVSKSPFKAASPFVTVLAS
jgi:hypothetical protein